MNKLHRKKVVGRWLVGREGGREGGRERERERERERITEHMERFLYFSGFVLLLPTEPIDCPERQGN